MTSIALAWMPQGNFHHVGVVVPAIGEAATGLAGSLAVPWDGYIIHDPIQGVRVTFLPGRSPADPLVEFIEPADETSPVISFLNRGGGFHHICYTVEKLEAELEYSRSRGALIVRGPAPATAFGGRKIAWVYTKQKLLIEYLER
jgi:methylmalonyl-CoA/ethylmalonyl-CoA epimerase